MSIDTRQPRTRLWCLTADSSPTVAILARTATPTGRWTHLLKWDVKRGSITAGAWSRLHIVGRRCRLSSDGQFLMYTASGPLGGPFSASFGGGITISRLPWLSALTFIHPACIGGGGESRHMLPREQQERLWSMFQEPFYFLDTDWPAHLGRDWSRAAPELAHAVSPHLPRHDRRETWLAAAPLRGRNLTLIAATPRHLADHPLTGQIAYYLATNGDGSGQQRELQPLDNIVWAAPTSKDERARIIAITRDAHVQLLTPRASGDPKAPLKLEQDHDLSNLTPDPGPAPRWATEPLEDK